MRTALVGVNIVGIGEDHLLITVGILHGNFDLDRILFLCKINRFGIDRSFIFIEEIDKIDDAAFMIIFLAFIFLALVL